MKHWLMILFCVIVISGCAFSSKEPFQIYSSRSDCVSCAEQKRWGFFKREVYRNRENVNFAYFINKLPGTIGTGEFGLCLGTALDTLQFGNTHFRIFDLEKTGKWYDEKTPVRIDHIFGTITGGSVQSLNADLPRNDFPRAMHYYKTGSPDCTYPNTCSTLHKFNIEDCPYDGDELRKKTEEQRGSLACIMKRNPRLLLHRVYRKEGYCGGTYDGWISAADVVKKYSIFFDLDK